MTGLRYLALAALLPCAACTTLTAPQATVQITEEPQPEWMEAAAPADVDRIHRLDAAWEEGLRQARSRGFRRAIAGEGALLEPDAALPRAAPSPGSYHCRVTKLGQQSGRGPAFAAYKPFFCYVDVDGDTLTIVKQTGSQRPAGSSIPTATIATSFSARWRLATRRARSLMATTRSAISSAWSSGSRRSAGGW